MTGTKQAVLCYWIGGLTGLTPAAWAGEPTTADELIAKYVQAIGGRDKIDAVQSMKVTGKTVYGGMMEAPTIIESKRPNRLRIEFVIQGMTGVRAFDGKIGWFVMPFAGKTDPEKMSEEDVKVMENQTDPDGPLVDYQKKGHQVEFAGKEDVEGAPAYKLKVTKKDGNVEYHFLDADTFLPIKLAMKLKTQGTELELEQLYSDYKPVQGLMVAHSMQTRSPAMQMGGGWSMVFEKVEMNPTIPDDRFTMPEIKKPEPAEEKKE